MINTIISMYITLLPPIIAGILNSIFCKLSIFQKLSVPIDGKKNLWDGKRIFGDNKTWKGLLGYIILNIIMTVICGLIYNGCGLEGYSYIYLSVENSILNNIGIGFLLGLGYSLFELPNSFLKRRLDITPGKTIKGFTKVFFIFLDQADSVFGCVLVVCLFYDMTIGFYFLYVLVGAITHIVVNMLLYFMKLRKNMF